MVKKTRPFYEKIYTNLFKKRYTQTSDRGNGSRKRLNKYLESKRVCKKYIVIKVSPGIDKRKKLHLTIWPYEKWMHFFIDNDLEIIEIDGELYHNGIFIMKPIK